MVRRHAFDAPRPISDSIQRAPGSVLVATNASAEHRLNNAVRHLSVMPGQSAASPQQI
jgi:hypothetical protein